LFVGSIVSTFNEEKEKLSQTNKLNNIQKEWLKVKLRILGTKPT